MTGGGCGGGGGSGGGREKKCANHGNTRGKMKRKKLTFVKEVVGGAEIGGGGFPGRKGNGEFEIGGRR